MRYFLNIRTKDSLVIDEEGDTFASTDLLFAHAQRVIAELEGQYPGDAQEEWAVIPVALEVVDDAGTLVFSLPINQCSCA